MVERGKYLRGWGPREDRDRELYSGDWDLEKPLFINEVGPVGAVFVGARVLRFLALRGGTRVMPSALERVEELIWRVLPRDVAAHLEAEAERVLRWIEEGPAPDGELARPSEVPELDMMVASDVESRLSVARFALDGGFGLELEYFDVEREEWSRARAVLESIQEEEGEELSWALKLRDVREEWSVELHYVRWLMPVHLSEAEKQEPSPGAEVVPFPRFRGDD